MKVKIRTEKVIEVQDWDDIVVKTMDDHEARRGDRFLKIVEKWKQFQRARITKSLEEFA